MKYLLFLSVVLPLTAQQPTVFPLESLRVEGNHSIAAERIVAASGLKLGRPIVKADFDAARERLIATRAFEQVGYEYKPSPAKTGYDAVLQVQEVEQLLPYRFEDLAVDETVLRTALRAQEPIFEDRIPAAPEVVSRYLAAVQKFVGSGVQVASDVEAGPSGAPAVVFHPLVTRVNVAEVRFEGNDAVATPGLLRQFSDVIVGIPYSEKAVRERLDANIRPLYEARGRLRVSFPKIATEKSTRVDVDGVILTVTVNEGPTYKLGEVRIAGIPAADAKDLLKTIDLSKGDIVNFDDVKATLSKLTKHYVDRGYLHAASDSQRDVHDDTHVVNVTLAVNPGAQYRFGKLEINGLDIILEPEIRKAWGAMEGKPFQPDYPEGFLTRLREEQVFENLGKTRAETKVDEASKTVAVTLYFTTAPAAPPAKRPLPF
ncbi:MAG TPA: POTRA domain-containing protein [Bryobacteraceae bacterium]|jgi:outer membrane protein assembly factor BamA